MIKTKLNHIPISPVKLNFFYGWFIVAFGTFGIVMSGPGQTSGVATFTDYLIDAFNITRDQLSLSYMIGTLACSFAITGIGRLYDRWGARWMAMLTGLVMGLVLIYLSQSDHIAQYLHNTFHFSANGLVESIVVLSLGFFVLRLSGQGTLAVVSRNMIMKWFVSYRGLVSGISNVFVAIGFSLVPYFFDQLIQSLGWREAWLYAAYFSIFVFVVLAFIFYRDNPEDCGLEPDAGMKENRDSIELELAKKTQFTLKEARRTPIFWVYAIPLAVYALLITGFTFNIISIFEKANFMREDAIFIFFPAAIISTITTLAGGYLSDQMKLKYLLIPFLLVMTAMSLSLAFLSKHGAYITLMLSYGMSMGLYSLLISIAWPRFFGRKHLGSISGFSMSLIVLFSAVGPIFFSGSLTQFGAYAHAALFCAAVCLVCLVFAMKVKGIQENFTE